MKWTIIWFNGLSGNPILVMGQFDEKDDAEERAKKTLQSPIVLKDGITYQIVEIVA